MGLDAVVLILDVESAFGIEIPNEEASQMRTAGDLYDIVLKHQPLKGSAVCLTSYTFYRLRRALLRVSSLARAAVRPSTPLDAVFPAGVRFHDSRPIRNELGWRIPALGPPSMASSPLVNLGFVAALIAAGAIMKLEGPSMPSYGLLAFIVIPFAWLTYLLIPHNPRLRRWPASLTVGHLAEMALAANAQQICASSGTAHERDVWHVLRGLVADCAGVPYNTITPATRFVEDLKF